MKKNLTVTAGAVTVKIRSQKATAAVSTKRVTASPKAKSLSVNKVPLELNVILKGLGEGRLPGGLFTHTDDFAYPIDTLAFAVSVPFSDSFSYGDSVKLAPNKVTHEVLMSLDTFTLVMAYGAGDEEFLVLQERFTAIVGKVVVEPLAAIDTLSIGHQKLYSDKAFQADTRVTDFDKRFSDLRYFASDYVESGYTESGVIIIDRFSLEPAKVVNESRLAKDSTLYSYGMSINEKLFALDEFGFLVPRELGDPFALSESVSMHPDKAVFEDKIATDSSTLLYAMNVEEQVIVTDSATYIVPRDMREELSLIESVELMASKTEATSFFVGDQQMLGINLNLNETLVVYDDFGYLKPHRLDDETTLADILSVGVQKVLVDTQSATEKLAIGSIKTQNDKLNTSDTVNGHMQNYFLNAYVENSYTGSVYSM